MTVLQGSFLGACFEEVSTMKEFTSDLNLLSQKEDAVLDLSVSHPGQSLSSPKLNQSCVSHTTFHFYFKTTFHRKLQTINLANRLSEY